MKGKLGISVARQGLFLCILALAACGRPQQSDLKWEPSREDTERYAYLWQSDLEDEFLFGANVIAVDDFISGALNMSFRPRTVRLGLGRNQEEEWKLQVVDSGFDEPVALMEFDVKQDGERFEVDFASAGNDVRLQGLIQYVGGQQTIRNRNGFWISDGNPTVSHISQDNDTVVVDLVHTVIQVITGENEDGEVEIRERLSDRPGQVKVRIFLQRKKILPQLGETALRTVNNGLENDFGFFSSSFGSFDADENNKPIQRFNVGDVANPESKVTIYLKDFPAAFVDVGKSAVESWNETFGREVFETKIAPDHIDAGDPRYHVIKWFDRTDKSLSWAGVARMIVNPDTGLVMGGHVYIQGSTVINNYRNVMYFSQQAYRETFSPEGRIGRAQFEHVEGENPVVPYFTDVTQSFEDYMRGYYTEVVAHELGHVIGLRHNFRGTTKLDEHGESASVMDYAPRAFRNQYSGPGSYDLAAIRWGYFGEDTGGKEPFCTDEHIREVWDCNKGDYGDPIAYVTRGLVDGTKVLTKQSIPVTDSGWISGISSTLETAIKMWALKDQMSAAQREVYERELPPAVKYAFEAPVDDALTGEDRLIATQNLAAMRRLLRQKIRSAKVALPH